MSQAALFYCLWFKSFGLFPALHHLDGCDGTFVAFVAKHAAAALFSLFHRVAGEQAIDDGHFAFLVQFGQALRDALADVVEVGCVATNDASDCNHGIHKTESVRNFQVQS